MSLCSLVENLPNNYFVSILNSNLIFDYYREFINCTVNIQINDIRQLPIIIPNESQCREIENIFFQAMQYKTKSNSEKELKAIENELDNKVVNLYGI